ncbi:hypothetical protein T4E_5640, partial [Trichinella pseudospiralis]
LLAVELVSSDVTVKDQFCRFLCHVGLAMRHLKLIDNESEQFQTIVEHYLEVLSKNRRHLLLQPFYVGQLSLSKKSRVYAKILQGLLFSFCPFLSFTIVDHTERKKEEACGDGFA